MQTDDAISPFSRIALINRPSQNISDSRNQTGRKTMQFKFSSPFRRNALHGRDCVCLWVPSRARWKFDVRGKSFLHIFRVGVKTVHGEIFKRWTIKRNTHQRTHTPSFVQHAKKRWNNPSQKLQRTRSKKKSRKEENHFHETLFENSKKFVLFIRQALMKFVLCSVVLRTLKSASRKIHEIKWWWILRQPFVGVAAKLRWWDNWQRKIHSNKLNWWAKLSKVHEKDS